MDEDFPAPAENGPLVDTRLLTKPSTFGGEEAKWKDWRFGFEDFMACVNAAYANEMNSAVGYETTANDENNPDIRKRSTALYAILASIMKLKLLQYSI